MDGSRLNESVEHRKDANHCAGHSANQCPAFSFATPQEVVDEYKRQAADAGMERIPDDDTLLFIGKRFLCQDTTPLDCEKMEVTGGVPTSDPVAYFPFEIANTFLGGEYDWEKNFYWLIYKMFSNAKCAGVELTVEQVAWIFILFKNEVMKVHLPGLNFRKYQDRYIYKWCINAHNHISKGRTYRRLPAINYDYKVWWFKTFNRPYYDEEVNDSKRLESIRSRKMSKAEKMAYARMLAASGLRVCLIKICLGVDSRTTIYNYINEWKANGAIFLKRPHGGHRKFWGDQAVDPQRTSLRTLCTSYRARMSKAQIEQMNSCYGKLTESMKKFHERTRHLVPSRSMQSIPALE